MPTRVKRRIDVSIVGSSGARLSRPWLREIATRTLDRALPAEECQVGIVIADDDTIRRLNRDYRGLDEVTDVLAFSSDHQGQWEGEGDSPAAGNGDVPFILPQRGPRDLGEVVISHPQAVRQAGAGPTDLDRELALLVVHGVLHLLGFDHVEAPEASKMKAKEREVLSAIFS